MGRNVADVLWEMLEKAGVKRCYGIVGDALNPVIDALRRNRKVEFVHVRNEECGVFAAVAEAYFTENTVAVCGTAGPGVTHLFMPAICQFECEQERFLPSVEFRHNELAEFRCTGRNVTIGDPPYA